MALVRNTKFCDFQAEYEGSIPFTRSNPFINDSACERFLLPTIMKADGMGPSAIAKALKIGRASVYRALAE
jgi:hypothetical protein